MSSPCILVVWSSIIRNHLRLHRVNDLAQSPHTPSSHSIYIHRLVPLKLRKEPLYPPASDDRSIAARTSIAASSTGIGLKPGAYCSNFDPYFSIRAISLLDANTTLLSFDLWYMTWPNLRVAPGSALSNRPGQIDAKRMPWSAYAAANLAVRVVSAALLTAYGAAMGNWVSLMKSVEVSDN